MLITNKTTMEEIKKHAPENTVRIEITITVTGFDIDYLVADPPQLAESGITQRDINGKWL